MSRTHHPKKARKTHVRKARAHASTHHPTVKSHGRHGAKQHIAKSGTFRRI